MRGGSAMLPVGSAVVATYGSLAINIAVLIINEASFHGVAKIGFWDDFQGLLGATMGRKG